MSNLLDPGEIRIKLSEESLKKMRFERVMDELSSNGTGVIAFCNQITKCSLDVNLTNFLHFAAATEVRHDKSRSRFLNTSALTSVIYWPQFIIITAEACGLSHPSPRNVAAGLLGGEGGVAVQHHLLDVHL